MDNRADWDAVCGPDELHVLVYGPIFKAPGSTTKKPQLRIGPVASTFYPSPQKFILPVKPKAGERRIQFTAANVAQDLL